jgi:hypothetical protein
MVAPSGVRTVFDRSKTGIVGSNLTRGMDICPRFFLLCCPVWVEGLRRADPPSKESNRMSKNNFVSFRSQILNRNRQEGLIWIYYLLKINVIIIIIQGIGHSRPVPIHNLISELYTSIGRLVGPLGWGISPTQGFYLRRTTQHRKRQAHIHARSGIRSRDPSFRGEEDSTCPRPRCHWNGKSNVVWSTDLFMWSVICFEYDQCVTQLSQ